MIRSRIVMLMRRRPFRAVLSELAEREPELLLKKDGTVNASAMARALGVTQPTITRALQDPSYEPSNDTVDKVRKTFGVSAAQARGEDTLVAGSDETSRLTSRTQRFAERFERLTADRKKVLEAMLDQLEEVQESLRRAAG